MEIWRQTNFFRLLSPRAVIPVVEYRIPILPPQVWTLLTATQQQQVLQTLVQISLELVEAPKPEVRNEHR